MKRICPIAFFLVILAGKHTYAGCIYPNLSSEVPEFQSTNASRIDVLLRFGEANKLCFGVEYIDATLLTSPANIRIPAGASIEGAVRTILGSQPALTIEVHDGIIGISRSAPETKTSVFGHVLPAFEARRGPLQEISNLLHMYLVSSLNPSITGFAGHYSPGDLTDQVGPFREYDHSLRDLLNAILVQSKGGAWITRVAWNLQANLKIPEKRRVWSFVEYGEPAAGYVEILKNIASELENDANASLTSRL